LVFLLFLDLLPGIVTITADDLLNGELFNLPNLLKGLTRMGTISKAAAAAATLPNCPAIGDDCLVLCRQTKYVRTATHPTVPVPAIAYMSSGDNPGAPIASEDLGAGLAEKDPGTEG
jgi:hypothetical protein